MLKIPCVLMRGGTSKGPVLLASDLPTKIEERDAVLLGLMGAGHELEIDGMAAAAPKPVKSRLLAPRTVRMLTSTIYLFR